MSLVDESQVDAFIANIKARYAPYRDLEGEALHEVIFATKPSSGACGTSVSSSLRLSSLYLQSTSLRDEWCNLCWDMGVLLLPNEEIR